MDNQNNNPNPEPRDNIEMVVPPSETAAHESPKKETKPAEEPYRPSYGTVKSPRSKRIWRAAIIVLGVLVMIAAGYLIYAKLSLSPEKLLAEAWLNLSKIESSHSEIDIAYTDQSPEDPTQQASLKFGLVMDQISKSSTDADFATKLNVAVDSRGITEENQNFDFAIEIRKIGQDYYFSFDIFQIFSSFLNTGDNPSESTEGKVTWIKATESEILKETGEDTPGFEDLQTRSQEIFENLQNEHPLEIAKILENIQTVGTEEADGQKAVRISADVNETELINLMLTWLKTALETLSQEYPEYVIEEDEYQEFVSEFRKMMRPWEVKRLEFVVGKKDRIFREILLETNAPSVFSSFDSARSLSRDAKRLADIRQIQTALELYYNDCASYPESLEAGANQGCPSGINFGSFLPVVPTAPTPAEGVCNETENNYTYTPSETGQAYSLTFCLGTATGGVGPGLVEASQAGIKNLEDTGGAEIQPVDSMNAEEVSFDAALFIKMTNSNVNEDIQIPVPENAIDFEQYEQNINEYSLVRNIRSALNSYHDQHGTYPQYLIDLTEENNLSHFYLPDLKPAQNTTGECSGINPYFNYGPTEENQNYHLEFCLIAPFGSQDRGKHSANKDGIDGKPDEDPFYPFVLGVFLENLNLKNPLK